MPAPAFAEYWSLRFSAGGHFFTRHASQYLGAVLAWLGQRASLSPNHLTLAGAMTFLAGAAAFARLPDDGAGVVACLALFQLGYGLDCADGQLARARQMTSDFGARLDVACDYVRHAALAVAFVLWLQPRVGVLAGTAATLYMLGTAMHLRVLTAVRAGATRPQAPRGPVRELLTALLDTPVVLLAFALLRPYPQALAAAVALTGACYLALGLLLARSRLR